MVPANKEVNVSAKLMMMIIIMMKIIDVVSTKLIESTKNTDDVTDV